MHEQRSQRPRRPATPAARGIVLVLAALTLAALLNAQGLRKTAQIQPDGARRTVAIDVTRVLARVSHALYLDRPRQELLVAIGRRGEDTIDATVHFSLPHAHVKQPVKKPTVRKPHGHPRKPPRHVPPARPVFTAAKPLRVWVAGDSLAAVPGQALERLAGAGGAVDVLPVESRLSTGLGRPDLYNWFTRIEQAAVKLRPNVAVLSFGADDAHDYMSGVPAGRSIGPLGSASWNAEYRRRVDGVTRELIARGIDVVWLGTPIPRGAGFHRSFEVVNRVIEGVVALHRAHAAYVDEWGLLGYRHHHYADYLPDSHGHLVLMRAPDGVHLEPPAGDLVANAVANRLDRFFVLRPRLRHGSA